MSAISERFRQLPAAIFLAGPIVLMVVGVLMASGGRAEAAPVFQATETPTATLPAATLSLFDVPTLPAVPDSAGCPIGTPVGYGTVTPSGSWDLLCSQCAMDDGVWPTPGPSGTPGPSPTPEGNPTATVEATCDDPVGGYYLHPLLPASWSPWWGGHTNVGADFYYVPEDSVGLVIDVTRPPGSTHIIALEACGALGFDCGGHDGFIRSGSSVQMGPGEHCVDTTLSGYICDAVVGHHDGVNPAFVPPGSDVRVLVVNANWGSPNEQWTFSNLYAISASEPYCHTPEPGATATVTPTPTPDPSYCATVEDASVAAPYFGWTGFIQYDAVCLNVGPYDGVSFLGFDLPSVPWILHLCLAPMSLGWFTVFTVGVPVDGLLYLMAAIFILRKLT